MRADLAFALKGALVRRFHTHNVLRQETNGHHSHAVAVIVHLLHPSASKELLAAALLHDLGERRTGDIPGDVKRELDVRDRVRDLEEREFERAGLAMPALTHEEARALKFADMLAGLLYILEEASRGNAEEMRGPWNNYRSWVIEARSQANPAERDLAAQIIFEGGKLHGL